MQSLVSLELIEELACGVLTDHKMAALAAQNGEPLCLGQLIELAAQATALYTTLSLVCRNLNQVEECYALWTRGAEVFESLLAAWNDACGNGNAVAPHLAQLGRLLELAQDRAQLYAISESERAEHRSKKRDEGWGQELAFGRRADSVRLSGAELVRVLSPE